MNSLSHMAAPHKTSAPCSHFLQPTERLESRRNDVIDLHREDEADTPPGGEDAQRRAESVQRLPKDDAPDKGFVDVRRRIHSHQTEPFGAIPAGQQQEAEQKK